MALETTHLPLGRFRGLRKHVSAGGSLYAVLREHYGVELERAEETIETSLAGPQEAEMLGADVGMPVLMLTRHSFATDGKPNRRWSPIHWWQHSSFRQYPQRRCH